MKLNKIFLFAAVALAAIFASCSDEDSYTPGKPAGAYNIGFANEKKQILQVADKEFDVVLTRVGTSGAVTVPITAVNTKGFTVPATATFADGEKTATIKVGLPTDMQALVDYTFTISIPEEYTSPYSSTAFSPIYNITVVKEDYVAYKNDADFNDTFWTGETWKVNVEYSALLDLYRVKDIFTAGYPLFFKWDKTTGNVTIVGSDGKTVKSWYPGLADDSYPSYYVTTASSVCNYDTVKKCIVFDFWWRVSAGSYGTGYPSYLYIE